MSDYVAVDWEAPYSDDLSVTELGSWKYARDPRQIPYLISVSDGVNTWAGEPKDFNFESLRGKKLLSHHKAFDEEIALGGNERGLFEFPDLKPYGNDHWLCTMDMSSYLWNVRSLADACRIGLGIEVSKSVRDRAKNKTVDDMKREGWWGEMLRYGQLDAQRCWNLFNKHGDKWPLFERRLSQLTTDQGRHGVQIDVQALEDAIRCLQKVIFVAEQNLPWTQRGRKPASPIGIAEECALRGIPVPPVKSRDPEGAQEWEDTYAPKHKFVLALRNIRKAKKTLATLETIKLRLRDDGSVAFSLKYAGAHTLRWAGDSGWNLQNMNKEPLFIDPELSFVFDKKLCAAYVAEFDKAHAGNASFGKLTNGTTFFDIRGLIIARPGMKLAPVDSSQIEPRVLNKLAGNEPLLEKIRKGMGIYEAFARDALGWTGGDLKTENKKLYALSKADVLGLGFKCGPDRFIAVAQIMAGVDITEGDEDFARAAAIDGTIHRRRRPIDGKNWNYEKNHKFEVEGQTYEFPSDDLDPNQSANTNPWETCVFVRARVNRRREMKTVLRCYPVYGMRSRVTVEEFRRNNPLIVAVWNALQAELEASEGRDLVVIGPHGGQLVYRNIRREKKNRTDPDTGETYQQTVYTGEIGGERFPLHGGILTENLVQWVARMAFAERMLDLHDRLQAEDSRQWVLFTVHDEAVPEILDPGENRKARQKEIEAILSITPAWFEGCPLGAEAKIVSRYLK